MKLRSGGYGRSLRELVWPLQPIAPAGFLCPSTTPRPATASSASRSWGAELRSTGVGCAPSRKGLKGFRSVRCSCRTRREAVGEAVPSHTRLDRLALVDELAPYLDRPFSLFGHSLGAMIAYELSIAVQKRFGFCPETLFVSGCRASPTVYVRSCRDPLRCGRGAHRSQPRRNGSADP